MPALIRASLLVGTLFPLPPLPRRHRLRISPHPFPPLSYPSHSSRSSREAAITSGWCGGGVVGARGVSLGMVKTKQRPGPFRSRAFYFTVALVARHAQWPLCSPRVSIAVTKA
jgi:hypothetical protein